MTDVRLIDANAVSKTLRNLPFGYTKSFAGQAALKEIENAPTIDAVPVVRCGECKHRERNKSTLGFSWCCKFGNVMRYTDFCSWGERKMDGGAEDAGR